MIRLTPMVKNILIINVGIFLIQSVFSLPLSYLGGLRFIFADTFAPYQFVTYMWIHGDIGHILGNMFAVFIFGPLLEQVMGPKRFLTFYLACGIGAGVLYGAVDYIEKIDLKNSRDAYVNDPNPDNFRLFILEHKASWLYDPALLAKYSDEFYNQPNNPEAITQTKEIVKNIYKALTDIPMVGASGAVFGVLMAFGMLFPNMQLFLLFPPIPVRAKYLVLFYGLYELYAEFSRMPGDNVAHLAHLGGMAVAFVLLKIWQTNSGRFY